MDEGSRRVDESGRTLEEIAASGERRRAARYRPAARGVQPTYGIANSTVANGTTSVRLPQAGSAGSVGDGPVGAPQ